MKTQIFATYSDFLNRSDTELNGVDPVFAERNPGWDKERGNQGCWNCSDCFDCSRCSGCFGCSDCSDCSGLCDQYRAKAIEGVKPSPDIPVIENIHQKVLAAIEAEPKQFDMRTWHGENACGTTHCRGGMVVHLAGEAGRALEAFHDTPLAAFLIYQASSPNLPVRFPRFYETNEKAMTDIERMAELERDARPVAP